MNPTLATRADRHDWDAYVEAQPDGLAYHRWAWKEAVERAYGFEGLYLIARRRGLVCGVLPTVHHKLPLGPGKLISLPYCDVGGVLADDAEAAAELVAEALRWSARRGAKGLELRSATSLGVPLTTVDRLPSGKGPGKVRMLLSLPGSSEALLAGFTSKHRSQVRKPTRDGLKGRLGGAELVEAFYRIFAENMRDLGSPVHSRRWVREVVRAFGEHARVGIACLPDGTPAAGGIILMNRRTVSIPWASSLRRHNRQNPNMLLYWTFLQWAADHGYERFDFGRSTPGEGTYRFKQQWGAEPSALRWGALDADGTVGDVRTSGDGNRSREIVEEVWRRLPRPMCDTLGPALRRYVSL